MCAFKFWIGLAVFAFAFDTYLPPRACIYPPFYELVFFFFYIKDKALFIGGLARAQETAAHTIAERKGMPSHEA